MAGWLSNLVNNLAEGIDIIECKYEHDDKKLETCGIRHIATALLNTQTLRMIYWNTNVYVVTEIIKKPLMRSQRDNFLIHTNIATIWIITISISINLFYCCGKVFTLMNIRMIGKNSMKHY